MPNGPENGYPQNRNGKRQPGAQMGVNIRGAIKNPRRNCATSTNRKEEQLRQANIHRRETVHMAVWICRVISGSGRPVKVKKKEAAKCSEAAAGLIQWKMSVWFSVPFTLQMTDMIQMAFGV